jgi:tRNA (cmo5U34)-methyltransferase
MSEFEKSEWAEKEHAQGFLENADIFILERRRLLKVLKSFYRQFLGEKNRTKVLDLGCGDGALTRELLKEDDQIQATLVDGSSEMLKSARERLKSYDDMQFIHSTFQELLKNDEVVDDDFDLVVSSLAIHHLHLEEKKSLFRYIHNHLQKGGYFLNIDTVKAPTPELESWYRVAWSEWIRENQEKLNSTERFDHIPEQYKNNPENHPDTLDEQLNALKSVGFQQVDCYYKYGIFAVFGGEK